MSLSLLLRSLFRRRLPALIAIVAVNSACSHKDSPPPPPSTLTASPPDPSPPAAHEGWQEGPPALDRALSSRAPVLLYMSSEWCPPCRALEANVLSKQAFLDATK